MKDNVRTFNRTHRTVTKDEENIYGERKWKWWHWVFEQDSASATDGWIVGQILTQNAASLVGSYYIEYVGK
jgi:hypothetical protein